MTWKCHVYDSAKGRYDMILGKYIWTELWLHIKVSEQVIESEDGPFKGSTAPIVDLGTYIFKELKTEKVTTEELFTHAYVKGVY